MTPEQIGQLRTPIGSLFSSPSGWAKDFWINKDKNAGWMENETREILFNASRLADAGLVVEIGSYQGLSTAYMAAGRKLRPESPIRTMYAIDPFCDKFDKGGTNNTSDFYPIFEMNMLQCSVWDVIHPVVVISADAVDLFKNNSIEVLFVDGDHTYEGVRGDFDRYYPKLMTNGLIMFHDATFDGPARLLSELSKDERVKYIIAQNSMVGFIKVGI